VKLWEDTSIDNATGANDMTKHTATFADGTTITRKTDREYGVAWMASWIGNGRRGFKTGFSASADKVQAYVPTLAWPETRFPSKAELADVKARQAQALIDIDYRVEIVPTVAA
jgi:hypothetical protein